jgi:hypothetical protein
MTQQGVHRGRPRARGTPHCRAGEYGAAGITPGQRLLFHGDQPGMTAQDNEFRAVHSANTGAPPAQSPVPPHDQ